MTTTAYLNRAIMLNGKMEHTVSSNQHDVVDINASEAGLQIETEDRYIFVPWHSVKEVVVYK